MALIRLSRALIYLARLPYVWKYVPSETNQKLGRPDCISPEKREELPTPGAMTYTKNESEDDFLYHFRLM